MPLGQGIGEMVEAVRGRIELSGADPTWEVTAGSFEAALAYARERFENPVVLARNDRDRWWPRVTLTITTDRELAASAPPLEDLARPPVAEQPIPEQPSRSVPSPAPVTVAGEEHQESRVDSDMPAALAAIFDHQEQLRIARQRVPHHD